MTTKKKPESTLARYYSYKWNNLYQLKPDFKKELNQICPQKEFEVGFRELVTDFRASLQVKRTKSKEPRCFLDKLRIESKTLLDRIEEGIEPGGGNTASSAAIILNDTDLIYRLRQDLRILLNSCDRERKENLPALCKSLRKSNNWSESFRVYELMKLFKRFRLPVTLYGNNYHRMGGKFCKCVVLMYEATDKHISLEHAKNLLREAKKIHPAISFNNSAK